MPSQLKPNANNYQAGIRCPAIQSESIVNCFTMEIYCKENEKEEDEEEDDGHALRLQGISVVKHFTMDSYCNASTIKTQCN